MPLFKLPKKKPKNPLWVSLTDLSGKEEEGLNEILDDYFGASRYTKKLDLVRADEKDRIEGVKKALTAYRMFCEMTGQAIHPQFARICSKIVK